MKTNKEIRFEAIRVINRVITLKSNVFNGCFSDKAELVMEEKRLQGIKEWAINSGEINAIRHYLVSHNFGQNSQFQAAEVSSYFNN